MPAVGKRGTPNLPRQSGTGRRLGPDQVKEVKTTMHKRILSKAGLGGAALALMSVTGCYGTFHEVVDPCYPERYNCKAREEVRAYRDMQESNGTAIEQTLYYHYFEPGQAKLNDGGIAFLERVTHRRPSPETTWRACA